MDLYAVELSGIVTSDHCTSVSQSKIADQLTTFTRKIALNPKMTSVLSKTQELLSYWDMKHSEEDYRKHFRDFDC